MPIRKNKNGVWQIDFTTPSGERVRCSSKTTDKKLAQHLHDKLKHEAWQVEQLNKKPEKTVEQALILLLKDAEHKKDKLTKIQHAKYWRDEIGNKLLSSLTSEDIQNAIPTHVVRTGKILSPATQNRYRSSIMRAINLAKQAGWIDVVPYIAKSSEPKKRIRWITEKEAERLLDSLNLNWMKDVCQFALLTGARMTEILSMTWDKINFANKMAIVTGDIAKSGRGRSLPLSDDAINLIKERMKYQVSPYVFHSGTGKLRDDISRRDFKRALQRANIKNFRFHDLRHTWASWHIQRGTPLMVLKELGGWETIEMVQKYAHLNADHLLSYVNQVKFSSNTRLAR
ncbi:MULTISPECIES: tyrosine-type recombinase/integrase [Haemophilus]|uniref:Prophage integrase n=1 Tax=Haemophilus aegyptius TaxID=197575 RepID=A0ABY1VUE7_HAEAE|nr:MULTISPECIES: site-specific integrase [Haemophilus]EGF19233.1 xylulose-5-phosphate/fructose-6-phosphate phosphoketolase [Haemophilus aegyptius ATCC 11116]OBX83009.1 integrase [Haemophilus aegyptius]TMQ42503.1 integrase [Haemophilus influenzae biotype aegyptius]UAK83086.1 site-specific integrase [Haemophilus aegyptius]SQH36291.1 prophage integrase [Haemophilus aegyptius]